MGGFAQWSMGFVRRARREGISQATLASALGGIAPDPDVLSADRGQGEFALGRAAYLARAVSEERVKTGRALRSRHHATLQAIEERFGVGASIVLAIWGLESNFGVSRGDKDVFRSLVTLAHDRRRRRVFEDQLLGALRIVQSGSVRASELRGSWAGAMGHCQFMPTSYERYAVDFDGDQRCNIWHDDPADALASAAHFLMRHGWRRGEGWGCVARLSADFDHGESGLVHRRSLAQWRELGAAPVELRALAPAAACCVLEPSGHTGPAFLVGPGFSAILHYNNSINYALAVALLADRIAGARAPEMTWPDEPELDRDQRRDVQRALVALGYDTGGVDGLFGAATSLAVRAFQRRVGLTSDGHVSQTVLEALRALGDDALTGVS